jgi:hypothetical protein
VADVPSGLSLIPPHADKIKIYGSKYEEVGIAQSVWRLATGWTTERSEFESR